MAGQNMKEDAQLTCEIEIFKMVAEHFRQDLREFWHRANFYLLTNAGLLSAFLMAYPTLVEGQAIIAIIIPLVGLTIAIFWFIVLRGALYWIQQWRKQVIKLSKELDRFQCYVEIETSVQQKPYLEPSYVTHLLPLIFVIAWLVLCVVAFLE